MTLGSRKDGRASAGDARSVCEVTLTGNVKPRRRGLSRGVWLAIAAVLVLCLVLTALLSLQPKGRYALVHDGDGDVTTIDLIQGTCDGTVWQEREGELLVTVETGYGTNVVAVSDGSVRVVSADCPQGDCMGQGPIDRPGQTIVCLPHRLWIEVSDDPAGDDGLDLAGAQSLVVGEQARDAGVDGVAR